ncbi:D-alanyl-D-alanine carboxypeptidase family protein [Candidatus Levibacter sp. Uisw_134_01]|uniref:D-alanyl-D-alanine carboxypeptidase family protein n=1 Tax=Candidatus Levibacter sp. Uisw_134_01 TaxID=3230999 RepID=UPI003D3DB24C
MFRNYVKLISFLPVFWMICVSSAHAKYASFIINENTKRIYHNANADTRNYPASLTKIMTLYLVFDALKSKKISMNSKFKVSKHATRQPPSKLNLSAGSNITVKNAILALVTKSANDVATVIAENLGKSERNFARLMTRKAKKLGMTRTTFRNASGLPNQGQLSTARDMATLGIAIRKNHPKFFKLFKTKSFIYKGIKYTNHNNLLGSYSGTDGIKTGYTNASGFNLVASVERNGQRIIGVVFGGKKARSRDKHMVTLLNKYFKTSLSKPLVRIAKPSELPKIRPKIVMAEKNIKNFRIPPKIINNIIPNNVEEDWFIQIGAFKNRLNAHKAARNARNIVPEQLGNLPASLSKITKSSTNNNLQYLWRVRFVELAENQARSVCAELWTSGLSCIPLPSNNNS